MTWLICYDIEEDSIRGKLCKKLEKAGFERLQKSVFAAGMNTKEFNRFFVRIKQQFEAALKEEDKIYAWSLSDTQFEEVISMGKQYDAKWIQGRYAVYYIGDEELLK